MEYLVDFNFSFSFLGDHHVFFKTLCFFFFATSVSAVLRHCQLTGGNDWLGDVVDTFDSDRSTRGNTWEP